MFLMLKMIVPRAAGAPVGVLCASSLGPGASDLLAEERRWTRPHAQRRLPRVGGWSRTWRLCSGETKTH